MEILIIQTNGYTVIKCAGPQSQVLSLFQQTSSRASPEPVLKLTNKLGCDVQTILKCILYYKIYFKPIISHVDDTNSLSNVTNKRLIRC